MRVEWMDQSEAAQELRQLREERKQWEGVCKTWEKRYQDSQNEVTTLRDKLKLKHAKDTVDLSRYSHARLKLASVADQVQEILDSLK